MVIQKVALPSESLCFDISLTDTSGSLNASNEHIVNVNRAVAGYSIVKTPCRSGIDPGESKTIASFRPNEIKWVKSHVVQRVDAKQAVTGINDQVYCATAYAKVCC